MYKGSLKSKKIVLCRRTFCHGMPVLPFYQCASTKGLAVVVCSMQITFQAVAKSVGACARGHLLATIEYVGHIFGGVTRYFGCSNILVFVVVMVLFWMDEWWVSYDTGEICSIWELPWLLLLVLPTVALQLIILLYFDSCQCYCYL